MPPAETTKEGSRTISLRLSLMTPDGRAVDYEEAVKNSQASYDEARTKLSQRERDKIAEGWDRLGRFIVETVDKGVDIETRVLRGKEWEFVGEPGKPPEKPRVEKPALNGQKRGEEIQVSSDLTPETATPGANRHSDGLLGTPSEAFLLELGELCLKHRLVLEGDGLRIVPFTMKGFRRLLAVVEG